MNASRIGVVTRIEIVDLGTWGGATLLAEYDAEVDAIRVNARAVERVRDAFGDAEAERFIACAVAHEWFHRTHAAATEGDANRFAALVTDADPRRFEALFVERDA